MSCGRGLFCQNFIYQRGVWPACHKAWCGKCYVDNGEIDFHIAKPENEEGIVWEKSSVKHQYLTGRNGDMLMSPFQCDLCWFRNIMGQDPD